MALVSSIAATMKDKKSSKPPKHWTQNVQECVVRRAADGGIHFAVGGGAENGQFPYVQDIRNDKIMLETGKLHVDDLLLELNNYKLVGYTLWDLKSLINHLGTEALRFKTLKAGQNLPKDLRRYLGMRMPKGTPDHDLQQTIRENLYVRTVPCTTRPPREGEVNGVDYKFLSVDEFLALEKSGHLLESGLFEGNHYGTPKPPQDPPPDTLVSSLTEPQPQQNNSSSNTATDLASTSSSRHIRPGSKPSAPGKRQRNKSTIEATTLNPKPVGTQEEKNLETVKKLEEDLGPLPSEWEIAFTETGDMYYIDHRDERTQWLDPRLMKKKKHTSSDPSKEELPDGWEKIDDPQYGTYYIDHVNRKTQFNSPSKSSDMTTGSPRPPPAHSYNSLTRNRNKNKTDSPATPHRTANDPDVTKQNKTNGSIGPDELEDEMYKFTNDPNKLIGKRYITHLIKGTQGFGFTIIGGDDPNEFLQIRNILPTGPAHEDGILKTGDVLVAVNKRLVLGCTHQDVVTIFQGIKPGDRVELEVCRGYPLPFDPADPKAHIVTSYAIDPTRVSNQNGLGSKSKSLGNIRNQNIPPDYIPNNLGPTRPVDDAASRSSHNSKDYPYTPPNQRRGHGPAARRDTNLNSRMPHVKSLPDLSHKQQQGGDPNTQTQRAKTPTPSLSSHPGYVPGSPMISDRTSLSSDAGPMEKHEIIFVKSNQGFGFTVADSPHGQKVKQILAPQRCKTLREGDLLLEINQESITNLQHNQVVQKLKECPQGLDTVITVQRGGLLKPVRGLNKLNINNKSPKVTLSPEEKKREEERFGDLNGSRQEDGEEDRVSVDSDQKRKTDILVDEMKNKLKKRPPSDVHDRKPVNGDSERLQNNLDIDSGGSDKHSDHDRSHPDWEVENYNSNKDRHRGRDWHDPKRGPHRTADRPHSRAELDRRSGDRLHSENIPRPQSSRPDQGGRYMNGDWSGSLDRRRPPDPRRSVEPTHVENERRARPSESGYGRDPSRDPSREPSEKDWGPDMRRPGPGDRHRRPPDDMRRQEPERSTSRPRHPSSGSERDDKFIESTVFLKTREDSGFGFRIIGGHEEGSQVSIGTITAGGVAQQDGRLLTGDELLYVDGQTVVGSSHKRVVTLMIAAGRAGRVSLGIRRRVVGLNQPSGGGGSRPASRPLSPASPAGSNKRYPYDVKLHRRDNEGFGLVVLSSTLKSGSNIGRIIEGSPADRCRDLEVGDRIISINGIDIRSMHHKDIVNMIKDTGTSVTLTIGSRGGDDTVSRNPPPKNVGHMVNALAMPAQIKGSDGSMRSPPVQPMTNHFQPPHPTIDNKTTEPIYAKSSKWKLDTDRIRTQPARPPSAPPQSMTYHDGPPRPSSPPMGKPVRGIPRQHPQQQPNHQDAGWGPQQQSPSKSPHAGRRSYDPQRTHPLSPPQERRYRGPPSSSNPASPRMDRRGYREPGRPAPQQGKQLMYPPKRNELQPGDYYNVDLKKGATGFGFSIRGGKEYDNTPLFVLRMADDGPAAQSILMRVGDQLIEINGQSTDGMLHSEAITAIRNGGDTITLVLRRSYKTATMDPRHMTQTPPPMFRNASMAVSNSSLQSDEMHRDDGMGRGGGGGGGGGRGGRGGGRGRGKDHFDYAWNYRSLPRGLKY